MNCIDTGFKSNLKTFLSVLFVSFCFSKMVIAQSTSSDFILELEEETIDDTYNQRLNTIFENFTVFTLKDDNLANIAGENPYSMTVDFRASGMDEITWDLVNSEIYGSSYVAHIQISNGVEQINETPKSYSYKGTILNDANSNVRMTFHENLLYGMFELNGVRYFVEPLGRLVGENMKNYFVIYKASDVKDNDEHVCGFREVEKNSLKGGTSENKRLDTDTGGSPCRKIQIAQAYEDGIITRYGSNANVSTWNAAIWNVVNGFYANAIEYTIEFEIVAEFFDPPFATNTCITTYLQNFSAWGNAGGFGAGVVFDIGNLWTTINVDGCTPGSSGVIGSVMEIGGMCTDDRYQIFEDFIGPTAVPPTGGDLTTLAILIAHEVGHNVGMWHNDDPAGPNIMEPGLNPAASTFSPTSLHYLRSRLHNEACLSSCVCIEVVQAVPINCSADGSTFDLLLTVEHENTSGSFTATAGGMNITANYGANPQMVTITNVPVGTTTVNIEDDVDSACSSSATFQHPSDQNVSQLTTTEYCETTIASQPTQNLSSPYMENYGSFTVTLTSDMTTGGTMHANSEGSILITDVEGNVVDLVTIGNIMSPEVLTVSNLNLDPEFAPYQVVVGDQYGDGLVAGDCFGNNVNGGFTIEDGQGNIIFDGTLDDDGSCGNGNNAVSITVPVTPAIDMTIGGNFSGPGVTDATANDGMAVFDPSSLSVGEHFINYTMDTYEGCTADQQTVNVYAQPTITLDNTTCDGATYDATVDIGLGAWNSVLSGMTASISITTTNGTLSSTTISADGFIDIIDIPSGQDITITVGNGTTENAGCQQMLVINAPTCSTCPDLTAAAPVAVVSSESSCTDCSLSGGMIAAPTGSCPTGSTLEYSTDGGTTWGTTLPTYDQDGPAQTIMTRCLCDMDGSTASPTSMVTTVPGSCPTIGDPMGITVTESMCQADGTTVSGGSFNDLASACATGTLTFYDDAAGSMLSASQSAPTYNQTGPSQTLYVTCLDAVTGCESAVVTVGPTVPGMCTCPDLTAAAPVAVVSSESSCTDCALSGGVIAAPTESCPDNSTLEYSTDGGTTWGTTLPTYDQDGPAQTVMTRCLCDLDGTTASPTSMVTTAPGTCPTVTDPTGITVTESTCQADNVTVSGGSFNIPGSPCTTGTLTFYDDAAGSMLSASQSAPAYNQTGPSQTLYVTCLDAATGCESAVVTVGPTNPGTCAPISFAFSGALSDPCDCNDDQSANGAGDGTFSELVVFETTPATPGLNLCVANGATGVTAGTGFTDNGDGTYSLPFNHVDGVGYTLSIADCSDLDTPLAGPVSNVCHYPVAEFTLPSSVCDDDPAIDLSAIANEVSGDGDFGGSFAFSGTGVTGTMFDPVAAGQGSYMITATYSPTNVVGTTPGTDANCPTEITMTINVTDCTVCNADNGTLGISIAPATGGGRSGKPSSEPKEENIPLGSNNKSVRPSSKSDKN